MFLFHLQRGKQSRRLQAQVSGSILRSVLIFSICQLSMAEFYPSVNLFILLSPKSSLFLQWCATLLTAMSWGAAWSTGCRRRLSQTAGLPRGPTLLTSCSNTSRWASFWHKRQWFFRTGYPSLLLGGVCAKRHPCFLCFASLWMSEGKKRWW